MALIRKGTIHGASNHPGRSRVLPPLLAAACAAFSGLSHAEPAPGYDALIQQGKAQLQATSADLALHTSETAIHIDADRWEGYALAGGALMNLKRYEEAADEITRAIDRAPDDKKEALRALRRQCLQADAGPAPASTPAGTTVAQSEIVLWKSIETSSNPADFQTYLTQYPHGAFASLAQEHLRVASASLEDQERRSSQSELVRLTWTDSSTSLMWQRRTKSILMEEQRKNKVDSFAAGNTLADAANYCSTLRLIGFSDWRLPKADELTHIWAKSFWNFTAYKIQGQVFERLTGAGQFEPFLWTSSPGDKEGETIVVWAGHTSSVPSAVGLTPSAGGLPLCVRAATQR